jgi:hypothetical protein
MDENIIPCEHCGQPTSFERDNVMQPHEGEVCDVCDEWCCTDCIDWESCDDGLTICKQCSEERREEQNG